MKRYRWLNFYIDAQRNILKENDLPESEKNSQLEKFQEMVGFLYGQDRLEEKFQRWLKIEPPTLCTPIQYHKLILEVESAYISGAFYPALTSACCIGEKILNQILFGLREEHRSSQFYKEIYNKSSTDDWDQAIKIIKDWVCLDKETVSNFKSLLKLRNSSVHSGKIDEREIDSIKALNLIYKITDYLFGMNHERFFWAPGEIYVKENFENDPLTKIFILPGCAFVGHRHTIEDRNNLPTIIDNQPYITNNGTDEDFKQLRIKFRENV